MDAKRMLVAGTFLLAALAGTPVPAAEPNVPDAAPWIREPSAAQPMPVVPRIVTDGPVGVRYEALARGPARPATPTPNDPLARLARLRALAALMPRPARPAETGTRPPSTAHRQSPAASHGESRLTQRRLESWRRLHNAID